MPYENALKAAEEQLKYWEAQRTAAVQSGLPARADQCAHFISQCQTMLRALERAQSLAAGPPTRA